MKMIVAVDRNWGIGYKGELLARVREDMKHFRAYTFDKTVILGAGTLATFPGGKPLGGRLNLILSRKMESVPEGAEVFRSVEELLERVKELDPEETVVIGGGSVYSQLLPYTHEISLTVFDEAFESDTFFPDLSKMPRWQMTEAGEWQETNAETDSVSGMRFRFETYRLKEE